MKENDELTPSQRYEKAHTSYDELRNLLEASTQEKVVLTKKEIEKGKERKRVIKDNPKTFVNTPIYRTYHQSMTLMMQIIQLMPKKTVKISDEMLHYLMEAIRWSSAAYEQNSIFVKHNSLCESISLMTTVRVCVNTSRSLNLIGKAKATQLLSSIDSILRQLVAWRGSLKDEGGNDER